MKTPLAVASGVFSLVIHDFASFLWLLFSFIRQRYLGIGNIAHIRILATMYPLTLYLCVA